MASIETVVVATPRGDGLVVTQVILDAGKTVWMLTADGPKHVPKRTYASLDDALEQNDRATTTAFLIEAASDDAAIKLLGKPPPAL